MKAVLLKSLGSLSIEEIPIPKPKSDEVLIKVEACGICGSDIRYFHGENPWSKQTLGVSKPNSPNMVLGHEFGGKIVDVGHESLKNRIGQRVAVLAFKACGECYYCRIGRENLCANVKHIGHSAGWDEMKSGGYNPGGMAEYCRAWSEMAYEIPYSISPSSATLLDGLAVAIHASGKGGLKAGRGGKGIENVLIMGSGTIGLLILQVARAFGAMSIISVDSQDKPLDIATQLGADAAINVHKENLEERVMELTQERGVDLVFDSVGSTFTQSLNLLARGGRLILLAVPSHEVCFDASMLSGERLVMSSANNSYPYFPLAIELMAKGKVKAGPIITHQFSLADAIEAFQVAENKDESGAIKVIIEP